MTACRIFAKYADMQNKPTKCKRCSGSGVEPDHKAIGLQARVSRLAAEITLTEIAYRLGFSKGYLSDLELGRRQWNSDLNDRYLKALQK